MRSDFKRKKDLAWKWFSKYIRLKYADKDGYVVCVSCRVKLHWKQSQAGHFIDGRNNTVLFDERLVYPQCKKCNIFLSGNKVNYTLFMLTKHTKKEIEEFQNLRNKVKKFTIPDLEDIIDCYKLKVKELEKENK